MGRYDTEGYSTPSAQSSADTLSNDPTPMPAKQEKAEQEKQLESNEKGNDGTHLETPSANKAGPPPPPNGGLVAWLHVVGGFCELRPEARMELEAN